MCILRAVCENIRHVIIGLTELLYLLSFWGTSCLVACFIGSFNCASLVRLSPCCCPKLDLRANLSRNRHFNAYSFQYIPATNKRQQLHEYQSQKHGVARGPRAPLAPGSLVGRWEQWRVVRLSTAICSLCCIKTLHTD